MILSAEEVKNLLSSSQTPLLIHVLPPEHFAMQHIDGAVNACSYETAFLDQVRAYSSELSTPIIVYGAGSPFLDSKDAAMKLMDAGYTNVSDFRGGLGEWINAGYPLSGTGVIPAHTMIDGDFRINTEKSIVRWTGRNLFNHHEGTLRLKGGNLRIHNSQFSSGEISLDMNTLACSDLTDSGWNAALIHHLRTTDFFDIEHFPTADITITNILAIKDATNGTPNYDVTCTLTLRGISKDIAFPAVIAAESETSITAQGQIEFDRTEFGSQYGSGKLFAYLGKHIVNDCVQLHLKIIADKQES